MSTTNEGILACAGAGKTFHLCDLATQSSQGSLLITYTNQGKKNILCQLQEMNLGVVPSRIRVKTWFEFLLQDIIKPYQSTYLETVAGGKLETANFFTTIDFSQTYGFRNYNKKGTLGYYHAGAGRLRHNETVVLATQLLDMEGEAILKRLYQQFHTLYFDEVQDLAGSDIDLLRTLIDSQLSVVMVGDPKQYTYQTHEEKKKNINVTGVNISNFFEQLKYAGKLDISFQQTTRRFGIKLAKLANSVDPSGQLLQGNPNVVNLKHEGVFLIRSEDIEKYNEIYSPTYLVYDKRSGKKLPKGLPHINFGDSKGITRDHVVILPNGPLKKFMMGQQILKPTKYYIAVTRAKYSIAFISDKPEKVVVVHPDWQIWKSTGLSTD
ncbi:UvrD-helicase domain-containing protein [Companilactobacillus jidongensis]|uniref:UvrD-helicase domain-containing protein n=1 Tax=Companilactobacillus jidongensis TaxID=2486006 RepID=UPI000F7A0D0D|nr:UvrD-helicase domain-containing protein [Companilactobacillus jidongensis]